MWHLHPPQCAEFAVSPEGGMRALNTPTQALPQVVRSSNSGKPAAWCEHVSRQVAAVVFPLKLQAYSGAATCPALLTILMQSGRPRISARARC